MFQVTYYGDIPHQIDVLSLEELLRVEKILNKCGFRYFVKEL